MKLAAKYILLVLLLWFSPSFAKQSLVLNASFDETWLRYPPPNVLREIFFNAFIHSSVNNHVCLDVGHDDSPAMGYNSPLTGKPNYKEPSEQFAQWYTSCLMTFVSGEIRSPQEKWVTQVNGNSYSSTKVPLTRNQLEQKYSVGVVELCGITVSECFWTNVPQKTKDEFVRYTIQRVIGDESVILNLGLASSMSEFEDLVKQALALVMGSSDVPQDLAEAQPNVPKAYASLLFVILHFDVLRY